MKQLTAVIAALMVLSIAGCDKRQNPNVPASKTPPPPATSTLQPTR